MIFLDNDLEGKNDIRKPEKLNLDDLFIQKQKRQIKQINTYNKILNAINKKILFVSRRTKNNNFIWYNVPLIVLGYTDYDPNECIAYLAIKMEENGFSSQFIPPNTLFITWAHWIPSYVRNEIKKRTGIIIDSNGNKISTTDSPDEKNSSVGQKESNDTKKSQAKKYSPIIPY
jgi:hypothetical protein